MEIYSGTFDLVIIMFYFAGNQPHLIATFILMKTNQNIAKGLLIIVLCIRGGGAINFVVEKIKR